MLDHLLWWTKQAWSLVDNDYLRFDFAAKEPLTQEQITVLEAEVNARILNDCPVTITEMSLEDAKKTGAKAFFEDKYGDIVRVIQISTTKTTTYTGNSTEFCGWTHVSSTQMIGSFKITNQEAVASGIRRIEAVTWPNVAYFAQEKENELIQYAKLLDCSVKQLPERIQKCLSELAGAKQASEHLQHTIIVQALLNCQTSDHEPFDYTTNVDSLGITTIPLKQIVLTARTTRPEKNRLLYTTDGQFALCADKTKNAKELQQRFWLKWGGDNQLIQWKDEKVVTLFT